MDTSFCLFGILILCSEGTQSCDPLFPFASRQSNFLASPGYPYSYEYDFDCKWNIHAVPGYNIRLTVNDSDIEGQTCQYDAVKFYDGWSNNSDLLGKVCGRQRPVFTSSDNVITVTFRSEGFTAGRGFNLSYQSGHYNPCQPKETPWLLSSGNITSPHYPYQYPNDADCIWTIDTADSELVVHIEVAVLDIEYAVGCKRDYLQAFDDRYGYGGSLGKWCGTQVPSSKYSSGQWVFIKFHSDAHIQGTGFKLQYSSKSYLVYPKPSTIGGIIGGVAAGCVVIIFIASVIVYRVKKSGRRAEEPRLCNSEVRFVSTLQSSQQVFFFIGGNHFPTNTALTLFAPPPSYDDVMADDQDHLAEAPRLSTAV